jgi:hypothetical protein
LVKDSIGRSISVVTVNHDITARKRMEAALIDQRAADAAGG